MIMSLPIALLQVRAGELQPENFQFDKLVYLGPLLVLVRAVLLIQARAVGVRALRIRQGLSMIGSLGAGLAGALASGLFAGWVVWQLGRQPGLYLFIAQGAPGSSNPHLALQRGYTEISAWQ